MNHSSASVQGQLLRVPFLDLGPANGAVKSRFLTRIADTIDRGDFTNGAAVADFERDFAAYCGIEHCVGVASGLDALRLALVASELEPGAGVVVPAQTFAATFEAVIQAGGIPVVADISEVDYNLSIDQVEAVAERATHIVPVHLFGQMADMHALTRLADHRNLRIVEDACQAHGARRDGYRPGQCSSAAAFSFYPAKNLGAFGDAGALVTADEQLASRVRALREHGEPRKYHHELVGYTARLDTIQAIALSEKLVLLDEWNAQRREAAGFYQRSLSGLDGVELPSVPQGSEPAWHLYVIRIADPTGLAAFLASRGIQTARHYPEPPHLAPAYRELGHTVGDFPVAESLAREGLSLPLYPGIGETQLEWVVQSLHDYAGVEAIDARRARPA